MLNWVGTVWQRLGPFLGVLNCIRTLLWCPEVVQEPHRSGVLRSSRALILPMSSVRVAASLFRCLELVQDSSCLCYFASLGPFLSVPLLVQDPPWLHSFASLGHSLSLCLCLFRTFLRFGSFASLGPSLALFPYSFRTLFASFPLLVQDLPWSGFMSSFRVSLRSSLNTYLEHDSTLCPA